MSRTLTFYAFEPGAPGVPAASGTGVFVGGLVNLLQSSEAGLDVRMQWLRPAEVAGPGRFAGWRRAAGWLARESSRLLSDPSDILLFIYPKVPVLAHVGEPRMLSVAKQVYRAMGGRARVKGQRVVVVVEDLPVEQAEGRAAGGGPPADLDPKQIRGIERTLFRSAHRLVVPVGFEAPIRDLYGIDAKRFRTFRRNIYMPTEAPDAPSIEFKGGEVDFFYSGSVDSHMAANFREILRSIRNAPDTRLHVCGPGRESVEEWLRELDAPNVIHYGQIGVAEHDWLARQCDVGLVLYSTDNPYNHLTPTMKYSAYLANGLAILSTDLRCVAENVKEDGVGQAMPIRELALELMRWATRPSLWADEKARAEEQAWVVRSGAEMMPWIEELAAGS